MTTKICTKCGEEKPIEMFAKRTATTYRNECKVCKQKMQGETERYNHEESRKYLISIKTKCVKCGETRHYVLEFHHVDPSQKENAISEIMQKNWSISRKIEALNKEIAKCVLLCANCHREFHYNNTNTGQTLEEYLL